MNLTEHPTDMPHRIAEFLERPVGAIIASAGSYGVAKGGEVATSLLSTSSNTPSWIANATGIIGLLTAACALALMSRKAIITFLLDWPYIKRGKVPPVERKPEEPEAEEEEQSPPQA